MQDLLTNLILVISYSFVLLALYDLVNGWRRPVEDTLPQEQVAPMTDDQWNTWIDDNKDQFVGDEAPAMNGIHQLNDLFNEIKSESTPEEYNSWLTRVEGLMTEMVKPVPLTCAPINPNLWTLKQLKELGKQYHITKYHVMRKADLCHELAIKLSRASL